MMVHASTVIFFASIFLILYTYLIYPCAVLILGNIFKKKVNKGAIEPTVAFLIAAYNEEKVIKEKIENTLSLDYPKDKIKITVVSDGSTDRTDQIVRSFAGRGVRLYRVEGRVGKTEARNRAVLDSKEEIVIFSDASTYYEKDAVRKLVRNFTDPDVGLVSGHYSYFDSTGSNTGKATKIFWTYENIIKKAQTHMGTLTGASGCINAFRRREYTVLPPNIIEDLVEPLMFIRRGWRVVFEGEAIARERTTQNVKQEIKMRIRVIRGGMVGLLFARQVLNPFRFPVPAFQLISHKVLRWLVPFFVLSSFVCSAILFASGEGIIYMAYFYSQLLFFLMTAGGLIMEKLGIKLKILNFPVYFCVINYAAFVALFKTLVSELEPTWETNTNI